MSNATRDWLVERFLEKRKWTFGELRKAAPEWLSFRWIESELRLLDTERKVAFPDATAHDSVLIAVPGWPERPAASPAEQWLAGKFRETPSRSCTDLIAERPLWMSLGDLYRAVRDLDALGEVKLSDAGDGFSKGSVHAVPGWPDPVKCGRCSELEENLAAEVRKSEFLEEHLYAAFFDVALEDVDDPEDEDQAGTAHYEAQRLTDNVLKRFKEKEWRRARPDAV